MKIRDLTELAGRNLREAMLRNSLTTVGIAVGVASLVAMLSLGVGLQSLVSRRLERSGLFNSVLVRPASATPGQGGRRFFSGARVPASNAPPPPLDESAREELAHLPDVLEVYPEFRFTGDLRFGSEGHITQVASLPPSSATSDALDGMQGRFFSSNGAHEAILQLDLARDLADTQHIQPADLIGKDLVLRYAGRESLPPDPKTTTPDDAAMGFSIVSSQITLRVVGLVDADAVGTGGNGFGRTGAYVPLAVAEKLDVVEGNDMRTLVRDSTVGGTTPQYSNLTMRVSRPANIPIIEDAVKRMGFSAFSLLDVTSSLRRVFAMLDSLLGIFGSLALAVASLGIINTLVMSILERRREIGVLKALGASNGDIRQLFFTEAGVMGLVGGTAGVILGWAIGRGIQFATTVYLRRQSIAAENVWTVPWWLVVAAIAFSVVVSLIAGMYPASRAAQLDPVEALRYE